MREAIRWVCLIGAAALIGCEPAPSTGDAVQSLPGTDRVDPVTGIRQYPHARVCKGSRYRCYAHVRTLENGHVQTFASPTGYGPSELASAYNLDTTQNPGATIAIIGAYGYANAESDLASYRSQYGLPPCTSASGCFKVLNQSGQTSPLPGPPPPGNDWTAENALDLDMASAACPNCKLMLVEANDDTGTGLFVVQQTAASAGASVISNSWGGPEDPTQPATSTESYFNHPGIGTFVATGDNGYDDSGQGPDYPGTSAYVTGVGGTSLTQSTGSSRGWSETAWTSGGSACSLSIPKPSWQGSTTCSFKASSDVSAVGDPNTGVAVYNADNGGWIVVGGTSAAAPLVAAIYALTGHAADAPSFAYQHTSDYYDITSGSNGSCGNILCNAGAAWDGPTGIGSPNGRSLVTACTPQCAGKQCGSDGCGGSCGTCTAPQTCGGGGTPGVCGGGACRPVTGCPAGANCGTIPDGCGGTLSCGTCPAGQVCGAGGVANICGCAPLTACPAPFDCGSYPDGCGGTLNCGTCKAPETCGGGPQANVCGCTPTTCAFLGANCGTVSDGCGRQLNCGTCTAPETCGGDGRPNACGCQKATCAAANATCGTLDDGCGGTLDCGSCSGGQTCQNNQCAGSPPPGTLSHGCGCGSAESSPAALAALVGFALGARPRRRLRA